MGSLVHRSVPTNLKWLPNCSPAHTLFQDRFKDVQVGSRWFSTLYILSPNFHTKRSSNDASGSKLGIVWQSIFQRNWGGPQEASFLNSFFAPETDMIFGDGVGASLVRGLYCQLDVGLCEVDVFLQWNSAAEEGAWVGLKPDLPGGTGFNLLRV